MLDKNEADLAQFTSLDASVASGELSARIRENNNTKTDRIGFLEAEVERLSEIITLRNRELEEKEETIGELEAYMVNQENLIRTYEGKIIDKHELLKERDSEIGLLNDEKMSLAKENLNLQARLISIEKALE